VTLRGLKHIWELCAMAEPMSKIRVGWSSSREAGHSLYLEFLDSPPEGIEYVVPKSVPAPGRSFKGSLREKVLRSPFIRSRVDSVLSQGLDAEGARRISAYSLMRMARRSGLLAHSGAGWGSEFDIFHSNGSAMVENIPLIVENDVRWIVDFEHVGALFGYYGDWRARLNDGRAKKILTKQLTSKYCRRIVPWTEAARTTLESVLPDPAIAEKTEVLPLAIRPAPPRPKDVEAHDSVRILFMGSSNHRGEFWSKGGFEVLEAFRRLRARHGDAVELNFRCWMPADIAAEYAKDPGIRQFPGFLPKEELDRLFWGSDIFLFPSHHTPGMALLEGMRFGLPVVAKDIWANRELVHDGVSGYLVRPSEKVPYYLPGYVPNWSMDRGPFISYMKMRDDRVIDDLASRLSDLVQDPGLRERMGQEARKVVEEGHASVKRRNPRLRTIYEEAVKR